MKVAIVVEGTYPYEVGGVGRWVDSHIKSFPQHDFSVIHIVPNQLSKFEERVYQYDIPQNVKGIQVVSLFDEFKFKFSFNLNKNIDNQYLKSLYLDLVDANFLSAFNKLRSKPQFKYYLYSKDSWNVLLDLYRELSEEEEISFKNFFYIVKNRLLLLMNLSSLNLSDYDMVISMNSGYAALLGSLNDNVKQVLYEHGSYYLERSEEVKKVFSNDLWSLKNWLNYYKQLCFFNYEKCESIISISDLHSTLQLDANISFTKVNIIPNSVSLRDQEENTNELIHVGFVGRIIELKRVKEIILSCSKCFKANEKLHLDIYGPCSDEKYYKECKKLIIELNLEEKVTFHGNQDVDEIYPNIDILVLNSSREVLPFAILEAMSFGIPIITTDVGECRVLVEGSSLVDDDKALGACGVVLNGFSIDELASAISSLYSDSDKRIMLGKIGRERIKKFYENKIINKKINNIIYERA